MHFVAHDLQRPKQIAGASQTQEKHRGAAVSRHAFSIAGEIIKTNKVLKCSSTSSSLLGVFNKRLLQIRSKLMERILDVKSEPAASY